MLRSQPTPALNFKHSENWNGWDRSLRLISIRQRRQPRGPTHPPSKFIEVPKEPQAPQELKSAPELIDEIVSQMFLVWHDLDEDRRSIAIQDSLQIKGLPATAANEERIERLVEERISPKQDGHYSHGKKWVSDAKVEWIWDGWIAEGYFNTIIAMQKVGKSTFCLSLIAELVKRTGSFLNYPLHSERRRIEFVIIGPDMNRRLWGQYGKLSGLLQQDTDGDWYWQDQIQHVFTEEDEIGLSKADLRRMGAMAEEIKARGSHPFFLIDSYSALMANSHPMAEENSSRYCQPLRQLKSTLGKTGSTVVLLHHSSQTSSKRSAAESNAGNAAFNRVPDQVLKLNFLADPDATGARTDKRVVLSASGRTGRVEPEQLLEQSPDWGWSSHGPCGNAMKIMQALSERDRLTGDDAICFDMLNMRTVNGVPSTSGSLLELRETQSGGKANWGLTKVNRLLRKLQRKGLAVIDGKEVSLNGGASFRWWSFERDLDETGLQQKVALERLIENTENTPERAETPKTPLLGTPSEKHTPAFEPSPVFHDTEDFPAGGVVIEDPEGKPLVVVSVVNGAAEILKVRDRFKLDAPIKERRWMVDVFPVGWRAEQQETELYLELEKDVRI